MVLCGERRRTAPADRDGRRGCSMPTPKKPQAALRRLLTAAALALPVGCSSMSNTDKGLLAGAGLGTAAGAVIGHATGHTGAGAVIGGLVGGTTGALVG